MEKIPRYEKLDSMRFSKTQSEIEQSFMDRMDFEQYMKLSEWIVNRIDSIKTYPEIQN